MADYVKRPDLEFVAQLENFVAKLPSYAATFGLTPAQLSAVANDLNYMSFVALANGQAGTYSEDWTKLKDLVRYGEGGTAIGPFPVPPNVSTPPTPLILPNVEKRFRDLAQQLKKHGAYTTAIGEDLGIEAPATTVDPSTMKPVLALRPTGGQVEVVWQKNKMQSLEIHVSRNGAAFEFLTIDSTPNYIDTAPMPPAGQSQIWKYKAIYRLNDQRVGLWSNEVAITVMG